MFIFDEDLATISSNELKKGGECGTGSGTSKGAARLAFRAPAFVGSPGLSTNVP
jgi:hypothetical protein